MARLSNATIYNRFNRRSHRGFWLKLLDALVNAGAVTKSTAIDSTYLKAQRAAFGAKRGRSAQAIGRSRGGWTTKVHALADVIGCPYPLMPAAGNVSDVKAAPALLEQAGRMRSSPRAENILLPFFRIIWFVVAVPPRHRGVLANRHRT